MHPMIFVPLVVVTIGCAANSDRRYRDHDVTLDSPLAQLVLAEQEHRTVDPAIEREALVQLEDLVESAASELAGSDIDYPTPELGTFDFIVEVDRRGSDEYEEWFYAALYPEDAGFGAKYLFDHAGLERGFDAIDHPRAGELARIVDDFVFGDVERASAEPPLRAVESAIRIDLGISEEDWFGNELRFDASVDYLGAFTEPVTGCPLYPHARIEIPRAMLGGSFAELIHTYGHELLHCLAGEFESAGEEHRVIEETSCEVFGARVLNEVLVSSRLEAKFAEALGEFDTGELAAPELPEVEVETLYDPSADFARLSELYRNPGIEHVAWKKTNARYGYDEPDLADENTVSEQIERVLSVMTIRDYALLIPELTTRRHLQKLAARAKSVTRLSLAAAREAIAEEGAVDSDRPSS